MVVMKNGPYSQAEQFQHAVARRAFLNTAGIGVGVAAATLLEQESLKVFAEPTVADKRVHPALPELPHHVPRAKRVIYLHMNGGPSQLDLWDYKPQLKEFFDKDLPSSIRGEQRLSTMTSRQERFPVAPSQFSFKQKGGCGRWVSTDLIPYTSEIVDELALVKSVHTNAINHDPACTFVMTGSEIPGKASIGSWLAYGLGSESDNLPAFVVLTPQFPKTGNAQALFSRMWGSGFLPTQYSGVTLRGTGDPVLYLDNPTGVSVADRRRMLDGLQQLNSLTVARYHDPETATRIAQYEMAFRMQASVPELTDLQDESRETLALYGEAATKPGSFAHSALLARRLVERGVRVVQILHRGWDQHGNLPKNILEQCRDTDQATAALIIDLKRRGLLEDTLVVWGGEFGRTVYSQGTLTAKNYGRDHHPRNFCMWLAGAGVRAGSSYGETDDFSYNVIENPVHVNDFNATILHLMGIDHEKLSFKFQGLDQRLTGVEKQRVVHDLLT